MDKRARGTHTDPLSAASAGLLALGLPLHLRTNALDLLAHMLDLANPDGEVELDEQLLEIEQRMGVSECLDAYSWLEILGVVRRTESGWAIPAFAEHNGPLRATAESFAVLRRHLDSVGSEDLAPAITLLPAEPTQTPVHVVALRRWRRTVPIAAAGIAAVAALAGASQLIPQAAVTGRNVALTADAPTTRVPTAKSIAEQAAAVTNKAASSVTQRTSPTTAAALASSPASGPFASLVCAVSQLVTAVSEVKIVKLPLQYDENGDPIWAAVVNGTVTNATPVSVLLQGISVVAHVVDGDTAPVNVSLPAPLLLSNTVSQFTAVVALGPVRPVNNVTATAQATGNSATC